MKTPMTRHATPLLASLATAVLMLWTAPVQVHAGAPGAGKAGVAAAAGAGATWQVTQGMTLRSTLEAWARRQGWDVVWDHPSDFEIRAGVTFRGSFLDAVGRLSDAIHMHNPNLAVTIYRGNSVIHVNETFASSN